MGIDRPAISIALTLVGLAAATLVGCSSGRASKTAHVPSGWPVAQGKATVTSGFGAPRGRSTHKGIDLAAPRGTPVRGTADGVVTYAARSGDFGRLVVVDHGGGWETRYAHLRKIRVGVGKRVRKGDQVGTVGHSGNAKGDHLHYEIRLNGVPRDPRPSLAR